MQRCPIRVLLPWEPTGKLLALKGLNVHPAPGRIPSLLAARVHMLCKQPLATPAASFSFATATHKTISKSTATSLFAPDVVQAGPSHR